MIKTLLIISLLFQCSLYGLHNIEPQKSETKIETKEEVKEWNIKDDLPKISVRHPKREKPGVIRILSYNWSIKSGEHEGKYDKEVATIFDTARRNKAIKVKPEEYLLIEGEKLPKNIKVELWEGEFKEISCKNNKIIIPNKVGKYPLKLTMEFDNGIVIYGIVIQCQR